MGAGPIPRSRIIGYGRNDLFLTGDDLDEFVGIIRGADDEYVGMINAPKSEQDKIRDLVPMSDSTGIARMMKRLAHAPNKPQHKKASKTK